MSEIKEPTDLEVIASVHRDVLLFLSANMNDAQWKNARESLGELMARFAVSAGLTKEEVKAAISNYANN